MQIACGRNMFDELRESAKARRESREGKRVEGEVGQAARSQ